PAVARDDLHLAVERRADRGPKAPMRTLDQRPTNGLLGVAEAALGQRVESVVLDPRLANADLEPQQIAGPQQSAQGPLDERGLALEVAEGPAEEQQQAPIFLGIRQVAGEAEVAVLEVRAGRTDQKMRPALVLDSIADQVAGVLGR